MEGNCREGVKFFLKKGAFKSVNATHKQEIYNLVPEVKALMDGPSLNASEVSYTPAVGDYIYFREIRNETSSHVGIVTGVSGKTIYTVEGNVVGGVGRRTHSANGSDYEFMVLGFGRPAWPSYCSAD